MQEIAYMLNVDNKGLKPIYFTLINSDKSSEFALSFSKPFITPEIAGYGIAHPNFDAGEESVMNIYINHLKDEMNAAVSEESFKNYIQYTF